MNDTVHRQHLGGPYYEDLVHGQVFDESPGFTLTAGHAAIHQAIVGDRLRLPLDAQLCEAVTGVADIAHPGLVWDVAIGQSTLVTQLVVANLFYRQLALRRMPRIGDTLRTVTKVSALRDNAHREGRAPTGLAALSIRTIDQEERVVLDFYRCAMLPMREESARPGHADDLTQIARELPELDHLGHAVSDWNLAAYRERVPGSHGSDLVTGSVLEVNSGDTVVGATELVKLTLNLAAVHVDPSVSSYGKRLVYGGHTIGIALAQVTRALPNLVTVLAWRYCDHLAPVFERDILKTVVTVGPVTRISNGLTADLVVETFVHRDTGDPLMVLKWGFVALFA